jgi:Domain of unknown function (DUF5666)
MYSATKTLTFAGCVFALAVVALTAAHARRPGNPIARFEALSRPQQPPAQSATKQVVGAIQAINGDTITLKPDAGPAVNVVVQGSVRILRVAPGQTDLKNAAAIQLTDLQVGDRVLARGTPSPDGQSLAASTVIAMKRSDVEAKQQQERAEWQRGVGGLVSAVDPSTGTISISVAAPGGARTIAIHTTNSTIIRHYAPDSVQFDDAKSSSLAEIKPGDQLRARGARSTDGAEFAAEEIVSGAFRNISGTISNLDGGASTLTVMDLATKKPVLVKISSQSQVLKLPPQLAQGIAFQMKGGARGAGPGGAAPSESAAPDRGAPSGPARSAGGDGAPRDSGQRGAGEGENARPARAPADLQQVLSRLPKSSVADLQKGDAVMIVSTEGTASGGVIAITLLAGVEPILQASPTGAQAMTLSPWTIGGAGDQGAEPNP